MGYLLSAGALTAPVGTVNYGSNATGVTLLTMLWPGPTVVQTHNCPASCTLAGAPTAGNTEIVVLATLASLAGDSVTDSVGAFTLQHSTCQAANVLCLATYDRLVTGSPTTTITITATSLDAAGFVELSGLAASGTNLFTGNTAASGSVVATQAGMSAGDAQICIGDATTIVGTPTMAFSNNNAGSSILIAGTNTAKARYGLASATASSTCTFTPGTSLTNPAAELADYLASSTNPVPSTFQDGSTIMGRLPAYMRGAYTQADVHGLKCIIRWDGRYECWRWLPV